MKHGLIRNISLHLIPKDHWSWKNILFAVAERRTVEIYIGQTGMLVFHMRASWGLGQVESQKK